MIKEVKSAWWDYSLILLAQAVAVPFSILYISLITRKLGPTGWGVFSLYLSIVQFLFCCMVSWNSASVIRFGKEEFIRDDNLRKTFASRMAIILMSIAIFILPVFFARDVIAGYVGISSNLFWLIFLAVIANSIFDHLASILKAIGSMKVFAFTCALRQLSLLIFLVLLVMALPFISIQAVIILEILSYFAISIFCLFFIKFKYILPFELDLKKMKDILKYSWPLIFSVLLGYASNWMDVYFIKYYLSPYNVGIYQAAYRLIEYLRTPLYSIAILAFPLLMAVKALDRSDIISLYITRLTPQVTFAWNIILSVIMLLSFPIVKLMFGDAFLETVMPFSILLAGIGFQVITIMYSSIFGIYDWLKYNTLILLIVCAINFAGDILLIPRAGISGAAISTVLSYAVGSLLYLLVANKLISVRTYRAIPYSVLTFLSFIICLTFKGLLLRIIGICGLVFLSMFLARRTVLFSRDDAKLLEKIEMPNFLRNGIRKAYLILT